MRHSLPGKPERAFNLHVLSMPPAFVLSQDQTLMFNPSNQTPRRAQPAFQGPSQRSLSRKRPTNPRRRPRIPSSSHNVNQQSPEDASSLTAKSGQSHILAEAGSPWTPEEPRAKGQHNAALLPCPGADAQKIGAARFASVALLTTEIGRAHV